MCAQKSPICFRRFTKLNVDSFYQLKVENVIVNNRICMLFRLLTNSNHLYIGKCLKSQIILLEILRLMRLRSGNLSFVRLIFLQKNPLFTRHPKCPAKGECYYSDHSFVPLPGTAGHRSFFRLLLPVLS